MIISISGKPGSGKSSVGKLVAKKLGMTYYSMGDLRREMARKKGMTIEEFNRLGEKDESTDRLVDEYQEELGRKKDNFVADGRTSFYFIPRSVKIFLDISMDEAAKRIFNEPKDNKKKRNEKEYETTDDVKNEIIERMQSDSKRYKKYYKFDCYDLSHYDFVLNTEKISIEKAAEKIVQYLKSRKLIKEKK